MDLLRAAEGSGLFRAGVTELELSRELQSSRARSARITSIPATASRCPDPTATAIPRTWTYEIHFVDPERRFGGSFEQWLELEGGG